MSEIAKKQKFYFVRFDKSNATIGETAHRPMRDYHNHISTRFRACQNKHVEWPWIGRAVTSGVLHTNSKATLRFNFCIADDIEHVLIITGYEASASRCRSNDGWQCQFPFNYDGRRYESCITGSAPTSKTASASEATFWCAVSNFPNGTMRTAANCRVQSCPLQGTVSKLETVVFPTLS